MAFKANLCTIFQLYIARPLFKTMKRPDKEVINWDQEKIHAFTKLKDKALHDVILSFPDYDKKAVYS